MALSLQQVQKQTQRLIMTPQMQQSIQLLQMNSMDLEMLIREEMLENPFLEITDDEEGLQSENDGKEKDEAPAEEREVESGLSDENREKEPQALEEYDEKPKDENPDPANDTETAEEFQKLEESDIDWDQQYSDSDTTAYSGTREDFEEHDFTTYTKLTESLYDSLMRQLRLSILAGTDYEIGEFIIGNLNSDGYMDCSLENQALIVGYPPELVAPKVVGKDEQVDKALRHMLATLHGSGEKPEAFVGMKRKELLPRVVAEILGVTYDEVAVQKPEERLKRLIARRLKRRYSELEEMRPAELILEVVAFRTKTTPDRVFDVLEIIQEFEPTGVAARDLAESLRLQCEENGVRNRLLYVILDDHLEDLQQKRFREISRTLNVPEDKVTEVFQILSRLDPRPGRSITKESAQYIKPDVYVKHIDGRYLYFLNEGDAGRLKVAANYRRMVAQKQGRRAQLAKQAQVQAARDAALQNGANGKHAAAVSEQDVDYANEKFKSAVWLIRNIEKRKKTILRVTEAIMDYQKEFLDKGIEHLRPLTLRDIAERVDMHESTIARVTTKKYVETPRGIFELKFFFSSGLETDDGEAASSRSIKELLTQMIDAEDKKRPLSDQKIADMLKQKGFQIARRTVAKYREQLKVLPAKLRKEVP